MSVGKAADRLVWAVDTMAVDPADRVLEIGCGHGVAISVICEQLGGGRVLALDRSAKMIAMTEKRNADHLAAGVLSVQASSLHEAEFGEVRFDKVLAIHVPVFVRGEPARELAVAKEILAPGGQLFIVYQPLDSASTDGVFARLAELLRGNGFEVEVRLAELASGRIGCAIASPV